MPAEQSLEAHLSEIVQNYNIDIIHSTNSTKKARPRQMRGERSDDLSPKLESAPCPWQVS